MIKLKMAAFAAILLGPSAACYALRGWKAERTLPAALCAQSLLLIALGYLLPFTVCVGVVAALSLAAWGVAVARAGSLRRAAGFLSLPCLLFLISVPIFYHACTKRVYYSYDEHSHWGLIIKVIQMYGELPRAGRGAPLLLFAYPPAGAMLPSLACTLFSYREGIAYFGYGLMTFGMLLGLVPEHAKGARRLGVPLLYLCMMTFFPLGFLRLFSEPVIGILAALLIVRQRDERTAFDAVCCCLYAVMLAMMKNTGIVILACFLLACWIAQPGRLEAKRCLGLLLLAAAAYASWMLYCRVQGIAGTASPSHFSENLRALLDGTISDTYRTIPERFARFFLGFRLSQAGVYTCYGFGTLAMVYAVLLGLTAAQIGLSPDRRAACRQWAGVWTANALYMLMIVASYYFFFEEWEVARLNEADRYMILPALWTGLIFCALLLREGRSPRQHSAAICLAVLGFLPMSHPEMTVKTFVTDDFAYRTIWARNTTDCQALFLKQQLADEPDARLLCMGAYDFMSLRYAMADRLNLGLLQDSWDQSPWVGDCEAVRGALAAGGYTHVFVAELDNPAEPGYPGVIDARYAPLTADGTALRAQSLYRVVRDAQGGVTLSYLATMPKAIK